MRIWTTGLGKGFTYPCTKRDVKEALGTDLLDLAWFGIWPEYHFDNRTTYPRISGRILADISVSWENVASLNLFRVRTEDYPDDVRERFLDLLRGEIRTWTEATVNRPDTAIFGHEYLLVALDGTDLKLHNARFR